MKKIKVLILIMIVSILGYSKFEKNRQLQFLYFSNGGLIGYFDDGTITGCPKCDLTNESINSLKNRKPHSKFKIVENELISEQGGSIPINSMKSNEWAIVNYRKIKEIKSIKELDIIKETQKLFDQYAPKIKKINDAEIGSTEIFVGDLNNDGLDDAIVFFVLNPAGGGNLIVSTEMAVYLNKGNKMKVVAGYSPKTIFSPTEIKNNKIHIIEYEYAEGDNYHFPSIEKHKYLILKGNKLIETNID
ncbi:hypothetical protein [Oceanivirga salmonicida]|uniref:hypothetical protein n=1 Tax=Oceanivirga salmonicida TaxID=1769291 RepID=UPI00082B2D8A|nr:hypothetical protein [Oceanivirga salmonicida]